MAKLTLPTIALFAGRSTQERPDRGVVADPAAAPRHARFALPVEPPNIDMIEGEGTYRAPHGLGQPAIAGRFEALPHRLAVEVAAHDDGPVPAPRVLEHGLGLLATLAAA